MTDYLICGKNKRFSGSILVTESVLVEKKLQYTHASYVRKLQEEPEVEKNKKQKPPPTQPNKIKTNTKCRTIL